MRNFSPSELLPRFILRLPPDLKKWVERSAKQNHRSQNSEFVHGMEFYREQMENRRAGQ